MKKIITVETISSKKAMDRKLNEFKEFGKTEEGLNDIKELLDKSFNDVFCDEEEKTKIAGLLFASYIDVVDTIFDDKEDLDETYKLFGKRSVEFITKAFRELSTTKAIQKIKEDAMKD